MSATTNHFLTVPVHVDALVLERPTAVVREPIHFDRLAYDSGGLNPDADAAPFVSENLLTPPLQPPDLVLGPGVHLHWALPAALTRSLPITDGDGILRFPAAPNLWLIRRCSPGNGQTWLVESDYLHPPFETLSGSHPIYPVAHWDSERVVADPPFRAIGRVLHQGEWGAIGRGDTVQSLTGQPLTALGSGDPTFAASYPSSRTVFGFHDHDHDHDSPPSDVTYSVVGLYRDHRDDFVAPHRLAEIFAARYQAPADIDVSTRLDESFGWTVNGESLVEIPTRSLYYGAVRITSGTPGTQSGRRRDTNISVAVGATATEAVAAHLAAGTGDDDHLEDRLEALQLMHDLEHLEVDVGPQFVEARHAKGFQPTPGGVTWLIKDGAEDDGDVPLQPATDRLAGLPDASTSPAAAPTDEADSEQCRRLHELNTAQLHLDRAGFDVASLAERLFADWYKYLICVSPPDGQRDRYPDIDEVKLFIEQHDLADIEYLVKTTIPKRTEIRDRWITEIRSRLDDQRLIETPGDRFWRPNEPVVVIAGEVARAHDRQQMTTATNVSVLRIDEGHPFAVPVVLFDKIDRLLADIQSGAGVTTDGRAWQPLQLEWEIDVRPIGDQPLLGEASEQPSNVVTANYRLGPESTDLAQVAGAIDLERPTSTYTGRSILSPQPGHIVTDTIDRFLAKHPLADDAADPNADPLAQIRRVSERFDANVPLMAQTLSGFNDALLGRAQTFQLPVVDPTVFRDKRRTADTDNEATPNSTSNSRPTSAAPKQPRHVPDYENFASRVSQAIDRANTVAPRPMFAFHPIRTGAAHLMRLRIVDAFGQVCDVPAASLAATAVSTSLSPSANAAGHLTVNSTAKSPAISTAISTTNSMVLPPRIAVPSRLRFSWLSRHGETEMNSRPASSPICGWVIPNLLDGSLAVADHQGHPLGSIDRHRVWRPAPGVDRTVVVGDADAVPDQHLRRVVRWVMRTRPSDDEMFDTLLGTLETALEFIDPDSFSQHRRLALLMGRPIAVVRSQLSLETRGRLPVDQTWGAFQAALSRGGRGDAAHGGLGSIEFPIRLGEHRQLNDGLVGYWHEATRDELATTFYSPVADPGLPAGVASGDGLIAFHDPFTLKLNQPPTPITMLIDPLAAVHATTGVLPTASLQLPADQFAVSLRALQVTFPTTPILTSVAPQPSAGDTERPAGAIVSSPPPDRVDIPVPGEPGAQWSWIEADGARWRYTNVLGTADMTARLEGQQELREGWLRLGRLPHESVPPGADSMTTQKDGTR